MTTDEIRKEARRRILSDHNGVPCGWAIWDLIELEDEYVRRIEEEMNHYD